jgi:hypothetical protein
VHRMVWPLRLLRYPKPELGNRPARSCPSPNPHERAWRWAGHRHRCLVMPTRAASRRVSERVYASPGLAQKLVAATQRPGGVEVPSLSSRTALNWLARLFARAIGAAPLRDAPRFVPSFPGFGSRAYGTCPRTRRAYVRFSSREPTPSPFARPGGRCRRVSARTAHSPYATGGSTRDAGKHPRKGDRNEAACRPLPA